MPNPIFMSNREDHLVFEGSTAGQSACVGQERLTQVDELGLYVCYSASAIGGRVVVETAPAIGYAGAWAVLADVPWVAGGQAHYIALTGVLLALRVRIVEDILHGSISAYAIGN